MGERLVAEDLEQLAELEGQLRAAAETMRLAHRVVRQYIGGRGSMAWYDDEAVRGLRAGVAALASSVAQRRHALRRALGAT